MTHRHVANGVEQLERQRGVITRLEDKGLDTSAAIGLLQSFEETAGPHCALGSLGSSAIRNAIDGVNEFVASTAAAVEEQSAVTTDMSNNMQRAAAELAG